MTTANDQIVSVTWLDAHQTAAAFATRSGKQFVLPKRFLPKGMEAAPCYSVRSARYANEAHTALIAKTNEAGDVAVSETDTPAMWDHVHASGIKIAPFLDLPEAEVLPAVPTIEPAKEETPSWMGDLLRRASGEEPPATHEPAPEPQQIVEQAILDQAIQQQQFTQMADDSSRRRAAKRQVDDAVFKAGQRVMAGQVRFEVALEAKNGRVDSVAMLEDEAKQRSMSVALLAEQIVAERRAMERRMMRVYAIQTRANSDIDAASGDAIDAIASVAAADINGDH